MDELFDVMILGAGAAGLTAGIYSSRAKLSTLILNEGAVGGQMVLTNEIANYPGVELTNGYKLANTMKKQAKDFGCKIKSNVKIAKLEFENKIKKVTLDDGRIFLSKSVILAPGGKPRQLNIPGEEKFKGTGISYCSTCDGEFFTDKNIAVIGGGNSALEEAISLTTYVSKLTIIHQFSHFQAFEHAIQEVKNNPKINIILESEPRGFFGKDKLEKISIEHLPTGKKTEMEFDGVFIFIGYLPNTGLFKEIVEMNQHDEILVDSDKKTNLEGVYAAGDCIEKKYRQVTTAVADGTIAALSAIEYLKNEK
jgi:thioredoxin reductase (NADPH)